MKHPRISVVILNWNGRKYLENFLPGVCNSLHPEAEVVVADNASTDDSVEFVRQHFPEVRLILNPSNEGYTGGYNAALSQLSSEYYVLLNSDVEVTQGWMNAPVLAMDNDPAVAACQPKLRAYHDRGKFEYAGAAGGFVDRYGYPFCRGRIFQSLEPDHGQYDNTLDVFWASGACMFVRSRVFHELGGLDHDFFAHMEEIDLCWRIKRAGYRVLFCHESVVFHVGGGTLPTFNPQKTYLNFRNNLFMLYKNLDRREFRKVYSFRIFADLAASFTFLILNGWRDCHAVLRAHRDFRRHRSRYHAVRPDLLHSGNKEKTGLFRGSVLFAYYLRRKKKFTELQER